MSKFRFYLEIAFNLTKKTIHLLLFIPKVIRNHLERIKYYIIMNIQTGELEQVKKWAAHKNYYIFIM